MSGFTEFLKKALKWTLAFIKTHFLPLSFLVAVLVAMLAPAPGQAVAEIEAGPFRLVSMINIIIVFLISGLTLDTKAIRRALKQWHGAVWGFVSILGITPTLGFAMAAIPFSPPEFASGLAIFCAAPTTLGVGAALVRQSKGNDALALLLLVGTNILAVFFMPLWLTALLSGIEGLDLTFDIGQMIWQLLVTVLAPAVVGKLTRDIWPLAERFAIKYKAELSMFSVFNLAFIVWQSLSAAQPLLIEQSFVNILYVIIAAVIQHALYLAFNGVVAAYTLKMEIEEGVAVTIMAGQKSAPVAITAITYITEVVATQGLLSVPCIVGQLVQIFMGALYAPWVAKRVMKVKARRKEAEKVAEEAAGVAALEAGDGDSQGSSAKAVSDKIGADALEADAEAAVAEAEAATALSSKDK